MSAQGFTKITVTTPLKDSLAPLLQNDEASITLNAGTTFPTTPLDGMLCYRTDEGVLYQYRTNEWKTILIWDASSISTEQQEKARTNLSVYSKAEVDTKIGSAIRYKGTVASEANLPTTDNTIGDLYNADDTGANYCWNGTSWDKLSETLDLTPFISKTEANGKFATYDEVDAVVTAFEEANVTISTKADKSEVEALKNEIADLTAQLTSTKAELETVKSDYLTKADWQKQIDEAYAILNS